MLMFWRPYYEDYPERHSRRLVKLGMIGNERLDYFSFCRKQWPCGHRVVSRAGGVGWGRGGLNKTSHLFAQFEIFCRSLLRSKVKL